MFGSEWMSGRVFWSGTMGRAEVRGNQQQQACSSERQEDKTGQDAGCSGRQALGRMKCGMGVLSLVLNQIRPAAGREWSRQAGKQAKKRPFGRSLLGPAPRGTEPELQCQHQCQQQQC